MSTIKTQRIPGDIDIMFGAGLVFLFFNITTHDGSVATGAVDHG
jgi:hypothetical protein